MFKRLLGSHIQDDIIHIFQAFIDGLYKLVVVVHFEPQETKAQILQHFPGGQRPHFAAAYKGGFAFEFSPKRLKGFIQCLVFCLDEPLRFFLQLEMGSDLPQPTGGVFAPVGMVSMINGML